ncbi:putative bifunctional diguanylate cyclase/phosphodiesterase [Dyella sp. 2RAB6]|uniref:putative bifunctional diguanylate cyclase/phosphodiesterase n=1 Tax=Dyella sp. 2RAB6 TaxID=3232992 RepID=UPI003F92D934
MLSIFVFGSLTAVLLLAVLMSGLRSDLRAQLGESSHRTHELAAHVSQAMRMPLRFSANSLTFIAEESSRLQSTAPQQSEVLLKGLVAEIMRRQPQILHIDVVAAEGSASGAVHEVSTGTVWASCAASALRVAGAPCFGPVVNTTDGEVMFVAAPFDEHRRIVADMQVAALQRALVGVPHANDIFFALEDAHGRTIVQGGDAEAAVADPNASAPPWWVRHLFGWQGPLPLRATTAIEPYPFKVVAGITYQKALAPWRRQVAAAAAFYLFYLFAFASLLGVIYRSAKVQRYYIEHLQAKTQELHTAQRVGRTAIWTFQQGRLACTDEEGEIFGLAGGRNAASVREFLAMVHPQDRAPLIGQVGAAWRNQDNLRAEFRIRKADGSERSLSAGGKVVVGQDGAQFMTGTVVDVTEQWNAHRRQAESEHRFHSLFEHNPLPFWVFDADTLRFLEVNAAAMKAYGYTREELLGMTIADLRDPTERPGLVAHLASPHESRSAPRVWAHRTRDGKRIDVRIHAADIVFNGIPARLVLAEDVGQQLAGERELAYRATHDAVTRLPNQHALLNRLDVLIAEGRPFGIAYIQLLGMDAIADTFGISVAAGVLRAMTARLVERVIGDEFLAAVTHESFVWVASRDRMSEAGLQAIVHCSNEPLYFEETQHQIEIVIGVVAHPRDGARGDVLFAHAALAAHAQGRGQRAVHYFEPSLAQQSKERMQFSASLRRAVRRHEFEMYFQPITNYPDQRLIGLEALMRWPQADGSLIPPSTFIPVCEESGLIVPLGRWVLNQVAKASLQLKEAGFDDLPIGVNISPAELRGSDLVANLRGVRAAYALADHAIHIELTESCLIEHRDKAIEVMRQLRADGVAVALDDFGTGFSSLSYLRDLPIDMLKIDQAFIRSVDRDARSATICDAIIALGKSLGIRVIAEGIERPAQYQWLHRHGCDGAQGFYLGRPERLTDFLAQWTPARARAR